MHTIYMHIIYTWWIYIQAHLSWIKIDWINFCDLSKFQIRKKLLAFVWKSSQKFWPVKPLRPKSEFSWSWSGLREFDCIYKWYIIFIRTSLTILPVKNFITRNSCVKGSTSHKLGIFLFKVVNTIKPDILVAIIFHKFVQGPILVAILMIYSTEIILIYIIYGWYRQILTHIVQIGDFVNILACQYTNT
jgi:hypothetical protein